MPKRKLTRKAKDLAIMRQFGLCGYCKNTLTDSGQTDHMDENCANDKWENLIACCCNCHGDKTQHYRKKRTRELESMLATGRQNKKLWEEKWAENTDHYSCLPEWLKQRIKEDETVMYSARIRCSHQAKVDFEKFRYHPDR